VKKTPSKCLISIHATKHAVCSNYLEFIVKRSMRIWNKVILKKSMLWPPAQAQAYNVTFVMKYSLFMCLKKVGHPWS